MVNENALCDNQMMPPQIQKELVRAFAEKAAGAIIDEIGDSHFSILQVESRDKLVKEQMAVMVRFVSKQGQVVKRFLGIERVIDTLAPLLKVAFDGLFSCYDLSIFRLRRQENDGASNMKG